MIDPIIENTCKACGKHVDQVPGHRKREFCSDTCRQRYHRTKSKPGEAQTDENAALTSELKELRAKVLDQAQAIEDQARELSRLHDRLDIEKRYLQNKNKPYGFKAFLKSQPATPLIEKLLADQFFMPRDTRPHYEYRLARLHCTEEERQEFVDLWKLMLLQQL